RPGARAERGPPGPALPGACAALPPPPLRITDALGVVDLIERGRALGAEPSPARGMLGIALDLADLERVLVDVRELTASRLAVEADGRNEHVAVLDLLRPRATLVFDPVVHFSGGGAVGNAPCFPGSRSISWGAPPAGRGSMTARMRAGRRGRQQLPRCPRKPSRLRPPRPPRARRAGSCQRRPRRSRRAEHRGRSATPAPRAA